MHWIETGILTESNSFVLIYYFILFRVNFLRFQSNHLRNSRSSIDVTKEFHLNGVFGCANINQNRWTKFGVFFSLFVLNSIMLSKENKNVEQKNAWWAHTKRIECDQQEEEKTMEGTARLETFQCKHVIASFNVLPWAKAHTQTQSELSYRACARVNHALTYVNAILQAMIQLRWCLDIIKMSSKSFGSETTCFWLCRYRTMDVATNCVNGEHE